MLKQAFLANALFSGLSGLAVVVDSSLLAILIPLPGSVFVGIGFGLLLFAAVLVVISRSEELQKSQAPGIIAADWIWVASTSFAAIVFHAQISTAGLILISGVNVVVAGLAVAQTVGYRRVSQDEAGA